MSEHQGDYTYSGSGPEEGYTEQRAPQLYGDPYGDYGQNQPRFAVEPLPYEVAPAQPAMVYGDRVVNRRRGPFRKAIRGVSLVVFSTLAFGTVLTGAEGAYLYGTDDVPNWQLRIPKTLPPKHLPEDTTFVCDAEHPQCGFDDALAYKTTNLQIDAKKSDVPQKYDLAVQAIEDHRFPDHDGASGVSFGSAAIHDSKSFATNIVRNIFHWQPLLTGVDIRGGSTITIQTADLTRTSSLNRRSTAHKYEEIGIAKRMEMEMSKSDILLEYDNSGYFGRNAHGVQAAAHMYFGKNLDECSEIEMLMIAGMQNNPGAGEMRVSDMTDPANWPTIKSAMIHIRDRTNEVIDAEYKYKVIDSNKRSELQQDLAAYFNKGVDQASGEPIWQSPFIPYKSPARLDTSRADNIGAHQAVMGGLALADTLRAKEPDNPDSSMRVVLTIRPEVQEAAYTAFKDSSKFQQAHDDENADVGFMSILKDGSATAVIGSIDQTRSYNMATGTDGGGSGFAPGSLNKLAVQMRYFQEGGTPDQAIGGGLITVKKSVDVAQSDGSVWRSDTGNSCSERNNESAPCERPPKYIFADSSNTGTAEMVNQIGGIEKVTSDMKKLGMPVDDPHAAKTAIGLGGKQSPKTMLMLYGAVGLNEGKSVDPHTIQYVEGQDTSRIYENTAPKETTVYKKDTVPMGILVMKQVVKDGTVAGVFDAKNGPESVAGKTGTNEDTQKWFCGVFKDKVEGSQAFCAVVANPHANLPVNTFKHGADVAKIDNSFLNHIMSGDRTDVSDPATMPR